MPTRLFARSVADVSLFRFQRMNDQKTTEKVADPEYPLGILPENYKPSQTFIFGWAKETAASSMKTVQESLTRMLTLTIALLGGSVAFIGKESISSTAKSTMVAFLILSLVSVLIGLFPFRNRINLDCIDQNKAEEDYRFGLSLRMYCLRASYVMLICAFVASFIGVACQ
jgi:DMSO reductase anchor subunit